MVNHIPDQYTRRKATIELRKIQIEIRTKANLKEKTTTITYDNHNPPIEINVLELITKDLTEMGYNAQLHYGLKQITIQWAFQTTPENWLTKLLNLFK